MSRDEAIKFHQSAIKAATDRSYANWATHAFNLFNTACIVDPSFGTAQYDHGNNNAGLNRLPAAIACYRRALQGDLTDKQRVETLVNMAWRLHQVGELEEALNAAREATILDPNNALGWLNLSVARGALGYRELCVQAAACAYSLAPDDVNVQFSYAFALLFDQQYAKGFRMFESRFPARLKHYLTYPYPKWHGEAGKTVFLVADQGLGDTLSFSRFIPHASKRAGTIVAMVQPALLRAFVNAFADLPNVKFMPSAGGFPQADCWSTFVSLPYALDLSDQEIRSAPHPALPVPQVAYSWRVEGAKYHIGIAWGGAGQNDIDVWRTIPLVRFLDLYRVPGVQLYSLQVDEHKKDLFEVSCESLVRDLSGWISDVTDTVGILQHLDLVISCESALPHIAGAIGKECWIPYSNHAHDYRLGHDGSTILWYDNHRLFSQQRNRRWEVPFDDMIEELKRRLDSREAEV